MTDPLTPFVGTEALASGVLNRHQLRTRHRAVLPDVYLRCDVRATLNRRIIAAWLWSGRRAVVAGLAAASMLGAKWIDDDVPVDLVHSNPRPPRGVITHRTALLDGEWQHIDGMPCTSAARTAFDIGRSSGTLNVAVARLDALSGATGVTPDAALAVAAHHPRTAGLRQLESALELLERMGWIVVRVVAEDRPSDVLSRVRVAIALRQSAVL